MCSSSTKWRVSHLIIAEAEREAEEEVAKAEMVEVEMTNKCHSIITWPLH